LSQSKSDSCTTSLLGSRVRIASFLGRSRRNGESRQVAENIVGWQKRLGEYPSILTHVPLWRGFCRAGLLALETKAEPKCWPLRSEATGIPATSRFRPCRGFRVEGRCNQLRPRVRRRKHQHQLRLLWNRARDQCTAANLSRCGSRPGSVDFGTSCPHCCSCLGPPGAPSR
jgi:hypothetical protein